MCTFPWFSFHFLLSIAFVLLFAYSPDDYRVQEQYYKKKYQHDLILWQCSSSLPLPHNIRKIIRNDLGLWFHIISDTWSASHAVNFRYLVKIYWLWVLCRFSAQLHWVVCDRGKILNWKKNADQFRKFERNPPENDKNVCSSFLLGVFAWNQAMSLWDFDLQNAHYWFVLQW